MNAKLLLAGSLTALVALTAFTTRTNSAGGLLEPGADAPAIEADAWFHHFGKEPTLDNLRGRVVLIEFWATWCPPCRRAWPHVEELHQKYEDKGLVVLGLSDEDTKTIQPFIDQYGLTARVAAGNKSGADYGVSGIPATFLIGADGKVAWSGSPFDLTEGVIEEQLALVTHKSWNALSVPTSLELSSRMVPIGKLLADGKLGKATTSLQAVAADAKAADGDKAAATELLTAVTEHVALLRGQVDERVKSLDIAPALKMLDQLAKELGSGPDAEAAKQRASEIKKDPKLARELEAAEALERTIEQAQRLSTSKATAKYEEFTKKHKGTRAADRALAMMRKKE